MARGLDFAFFPHPSLAAIRGYGATFVCRYVSPQTGSDASGKNLLPGEARQLLAAGIRIVIVAEQDAQRMAGGHAAGTADAAHADAVVKALGMAGIPVYFACDWDADPDDQAQINSYLDGAADVIGAARTGIYGGYWPVKRAFDGGHARYGWQTYAWSRTAAGVDPGQHAAVVRLDGYDYWFDTRAQLRQIRNGITVGGASCDLDESVAGDFGQWPRPVPSAPGAAAAPRNLAVRAGDTSVQVTRCDPPAGFPADHYEVSVFTGSYPSPETLVDSYPRYMKAAPKLFGSLQGIPSGTHMTCRAGAVDRDGNRSAYADVHFEMP